ncbi:MAG: hypothetical protein J0I07_18125 [Myxococcales bacterium]|nr:hypothetical protein [Myxococcales bacterium]
MTKLHLKTFSAACFMIRLLVGCSSDPDAPAGPALPDDDRDSGTSHVDAGGGDAHVEDDAASDAAPDRRIEWDSGGDAGAPVVLDMWAHSTTFCARVQRSSGTTVECWGNNNAGQLGRGDVTPIVAMGTTFKPFPIDSPDAPTFRVIRSANATNGTICGVTDDDDLKCWGGAYGTTAVKASVPAEPFLTGVADVSVGQSHACAILTDSRVACWGASSSGVLGLGTPGGVVQPVPQVIPDFTADQVSCGITTTCAVKDGEVWCWGAGSLTGNGMVFNPVTSPTRVAGLSGIKKVQANTYTFALAEDKTLWFWGSGLESMPSYTPTRVLDPTPDEPNRMMSDVEDVAGNCLLFTNGKVRCLAVVDGVYRFNEMPRVSDAVRLEPLCALSSAGSLRCWGINNAGQLGVPSTQLARSAGSVELKF